MNVTKFSEASNILDSVSDDDDMVNSPAHYNFAGVECIDAIQDALTPEEFRGFLKGTVMKYIWRLPFKFNPFEDCEKALWYLKRLRGLLTPKDYGLYKKKLEKEEAKDS